MIRNTPRPTSDPTARVPGLPLLQRVVIHTQAEPQRTFSVKLTSWKGPPPDWDPDEGDEADLWTVTETLITGVRYGLPSSETLTVDTVGWIAYFEGRPYLIIAECA